METKQINEFKRKKKIRKKKKLRCVCHQLLLLCVVIKPGKGEIETVSLDAHCFPKKKSDFPCS